VTDRDAGAGTTVLVTGAAGFIGSALCEKLVANGSRVIAYDNLSRGRREYLSNQVTLVEADIRDGPRLEETLHATKPDCVVHLAAMHFIPECIARPQDTLDVNVEGTRRVLESCQGTSVRCVVFASSAAVYAPSDAACVEDVTPLAPLEVYGESKVAAEQLARAFHQVTGTPTIVLRLFNAVGRRETNPHVIPHIFESLRTSDTIALGNTAPRRDYVDTRDVADAVISVLDRDGFHVLNVGTGSAHSVDDVVESLRRILARPITVVQEPSRTRASERMLLLADAARIRSLTGWRARVRLEETLRDLVLAYGV
jgi:UDP-glucose 4-epimerase